jgi:hypothetical protein
MGGDACELNSKQHRKICHTTWFCLTGKSFKETTYNLQHVATLSLFLLDAAEIQIPGTLLWIRIFGFECGTTYS